MVYITENQVEDILEGIKMDKCVLILGPLFATDKDGNKIQNSLRQRLVDSGFSLDDEYQNLFIADQSADDWGITSKIITFYENAVPNDIYDGVAKIRFNSILTFTQDVFLLNAFKRQKFDYIFKYFSADGSKQNEESDVVDKTNKPPVIYNVFGHYKDSNSLIISYSSFYEFLFSILGNKQTFPLELITKLSESRVFVLLGFDLKKWYVPLLITKLYKLGRDNSNQNRPMAVATLNDTDTSNEEYVRWLTRYPLSIKFIQGTSQQFIDKALADKNVFRKSHQGQLRQPPNEEILFYDDPAFQNKKIMYLEKIGSTGNEDDLLTVSIEIFSFFLEKNYSHEAQNFLTGIKGRLANIIFEKAKGNVDRSDVKVLNQVRDDLMKFINR